MPRFFMFGTSHWLTNPPTINAAYAFCVEGQPERFYWARGTTTDRVLPLREAGSRIMEAVLLLEDPWQEIEFITSATDLESRVGFLIDRDARRKKGKALPLKQGEAEWLRFALQFRSSRVKNGSPYLHGDTKNFNAAKAEARRQCNRTDLPNEADPSFTQGDPFDLFSDLNTLFEPGEAATANNHGSL